MRKKEPPRKIAKTKENAIVRWRMIRGGTVAASFSQDWMAIEVIKRNAKMTRSTIMRALLHS